MRVGARRGLRGAAAVTFLALLAACAAPSAHDRRVVIDDLAAAPAWTPARQHEVAAELAGAGFDPATLARACARLDPASISAALGLAAVPRSVAGLLDCTWVLGPATGGPRGRLYLVLVEPKSGQHFSSDTRDLLTGTVPVPSLGADAFFAPTISTLFFEVGDATLFLQEVVDPPRPSARTRTGLTRLAARVAGT